MIFQSRVKRNYQILLNHFFFLILLNQTVLSPPFLTQKSRCSDALYWTSNQAGYNSREARARNGVDIKITSRYRECPERTPRRFAAAIVKLSIRLPRRVTPWIICTHRVIGACNDPRWAPPDRAPPGAVWEQLPRAPTWRSRSLGGLAGRRAYSPPPWRHFRPPASAIARSPRRRCTWSPRTGRS